MDFTKSHLNLLIQLAEADKHFAGVEREMILSIAHSQNISDDEVRRLIKNPVPIELDHLTSDHKFEFMISAIQLIFADKNLFDVEIAFCKRIAAKLGFSDEAVDFLVSNYQGQPIDKLRTLVQRYQQ